jgi:uncharacterized glyoxalase superfamily protein PhnB
MATQPVKYIREGFHTTTPYLIVAGAARLIDFLKQAFGAEETFRAMRPDTPDAIMHAEVRIGDSTIELADATPQYPPRPTALHLYVPDADAVYQRALTAGATSMYAPMDQDYGDREAGVKDDSGNQWYIATHKGATYIPEGLRSVTPYLHVRGTARLIEFVKGAFGAEEVGVYKSPDGTIVHAKIRIGESVIEMGEAHGEWQPMPATLHMHVEDADAGYQRAIAAGGTSISEPEDKPYGERSGGVQDPAGNSWYIATPIRDAPA